MTPCTHNFFCSMIISLGRTCCYSCVNCMIDILVSSLIVVCSSKHTISPVPVVGFPRRGWNQRSLWPSQGLGLLLPSDPKPNYHQFGQGVEGILHTERGGTQKSVFNTAIYMMFDGIQTVQCFLLELCLLCDLHLFSASYNLQRLNFERKQLNFERKPLHIFF